LNDEVMAMRGSSTRRLDFRDYKINYYNLMILPSYD
jgi:hypothetical protein